MKAAWKTPDKSEPDQVPPGVTVYAMVLPDSEAGGKPSGDATPREAPADTDGAPTDTSEDRAGSSED